ncbi:MAG TPA: lactate utilization protein [Negativicutes bacterium]|nr:lactate utilization protein [Negativicutes bacterium]
MKDKCSTSSERIAQTINSLRRNGFDAWYVNSHIEAEQLFWDEIYKKVIPLTASWGDSMTLHSTGILTRLREEPGIELIETFGGHLTREQQINNRKRALSCDMFLTGSNAVTVRGQLVNLDMVGNRVAGIAFGPGNVVIFIGVNKIVDNIDEAVNRIKTVAAPLNAKRHPEFNTPCAVTGECADCNSPKRICNTWAITEKSYPIGRIKIILINEQLGL